MNARIQDSAPAQRSARGLAYERFCANLRSKIQSGDARVKAENEKILRCKTLSVGDVQTSTVLEGMSSMYANDEYIGLRLMPVLDMGKRVAEFYKYDKRDRTAYPDDTMDVRSKANEVNETRSKDSIALQGRALKEFVDQTVLNNQDAPLNEMVDAQDTVMEGLLLKQEQRIATVMTTAGNYDGNTTAVAASDRWDVEGNPLPVINDALASMWTGRGASRRVAFCSLDVWNHLKVNPYLLDLLRIKDGMITREQFVSMFEIDELLVGAARNDTANEGQDASHDRIWSDVFGVVRVAVTPSRRNAVFGYTFREKAPVQRMWFDPSSGEEGGWYTQASFADKSQVVAGDTGYLITTPIG